MEKNKIEELKERAQNLWNSVVKGEEEGNFEENSRGKIVIFSIAFVLSLCLWLMVNLSRDYNLSVNLPIQLGNMPEDQALTEDLPDYATVSISGEGWKLINIYNNPPPIFVDVSESEINLYDQVVEQMNANPDLNVQKVQPLILSLDMEQKISKKVPVVSNVSVSFDGQYDFTGTPHFEPDSVVISGAASILQNVNRWETEEIEIEDVEEDLSASISLKEPQALISVSPATVTYNATVAQFTEGEVRVAIEARNMPVDRSVSFSPAYVNVSFDVPVDQYAAVQNLSEPFVAYVTYDQLLRDTTGSIVPNVEKSASVELDLRLRSFQPNQVSYFTVLDE